MSIRSYFGEYEEAPEFDQGYLENIVAGTPAPVTAMPTPTPPAPVTAMPYQDAGQQAPQARTAPTSSYQFDPTTLGEAQKYYKAPELSEDLWQRELENYETQRETPVNYSSTSRVGGQRREDVPTSYEEWVQQQYQKAGEGAKTAYTGELTNDLTSQLTEHWGGMGVDPNIRGINRANELAQVLAHYGISDLSQLSVKESPYEYIGGGGSSGGDTEYYTEPSLIKDVRGQLVYGDKTFGELGSWGGEGEKNFGTPQEFMTRVGDNTYKLSHSAAGKGRVEYFVHTDPKTGQVQAISPKWSSSSDLTPDLMKFLSLAAIPLTGGLSSALAPTLGAIGSQVAAGALIGGGLGGLGSVAQGGSFGKGFGKGALRGGAMAGVSPYIGDVGKAVSGYVGGDLGTVLGGATTGALKSATGAVLSGTSIGDALISGGLSGGVGAGTTALGKEYLSDLPPSVRSAVTSAVSAGILGKDPTQAAINAFLGSAMGKQAVASKQNAAEGAPMTAEQLDLDEVLHNAYGTVESRISRGQDIYSPPTEEDKTGAGAGGADLFGDFDPQLDALIYQSDLNDLLDKDTASAATAPTDQTVDIIGQRGDESIFGESIDPFTLEELNQPIVAGPGAPITTAPAQQVEVTGQLAPAGETDFGEAIPPMTPEELAQVVAGNGTPPGQRVEVTGNRPIEPYSYDDVLDLVDKLQTDVGYVPPGQRVEVTAKRDGAVDTSGVLTEEEIAKIVPEDRQTIGVTGKRDGFPPYEIEDLLPGTGRTDTTERRVNVTEGTPERIEVTGKRFPPDEVTETGSAPSGGGVEEEDQITRTTAPGGTGTSPATGGTGPGGTGPGGSGTKPADKAKSGTGLSIEDLFALLGQRAPAAYEPYQVANITAKSPFGTIFDSYGGQDQQPSMEELLSIIGRG